MICADIDNEARDQRYTRHISRENVILKLSFDHFDLSKIDIYCDVTIYFIPCTYLKPKKSNENHYLTIIFVNFHKNVNQPITRIGSF